MSDANDSIEADEILERAMIRGNRAMWTIALQVRRIRTTEPEDGEFLGRRQADFEFLVIAATRLRRAATLATYAPAAQDRIVLALNAFDNSLPGLKKLRDVAEHIDDYSVDQGYDANVLPRYLENCAISNKGQTWSWLGESINTQDVLDASCALFHELKCVRGSTQDARVTLCDKVNE